MAQIYLTGNVPSALGLDYSRNVSLSGGGGAQDYISSVVADIYMSTNAYANTYYVTVTLKNSSGGVLASSNRADIKFNADNFGGANWQFEFSTGFDVNAIASFDIIAAANGSKIFVKLGQSVTITYTVYTACGAPSASINASLAEGDPTLTWSGAYGGAANGITGYEIQYAESANNSTWGAWTALKTVSSGGTGGSTTVTISPTRGYYRKYCIRTQGSAGASYYSGWTETGSCRRNSQPTELTSFSATPPVYVSGTITLSYSGATDADNNISTYNVSYATSADGTTWSGWTALANGATSHTPTLPPGHYIKYAARPVDAFGVSPVNWLESNVCGKNTAPAAPAITYPQDSKTIYNSRPRILVTLGADPEGHTQTINSEGFTPSQNNVSSAAKIVLRKSDAASAGAVSFAMTTTDQYGESSGEVTRSTTYAAPSFTDAALVGGTTRIKAAHMTELRAMINNIRAYYGFGVNHYSNSKPYVLYTAPDQAYPIEITGRNADDYLNGFSITGSNPGLGPGSNYLRIANVINGNGFWTVSFDIKGMQSVALSVKVDICDIGITTFHTNADNTYERKSLTVNVTNSYNFVDFTDFLYAYYKIANIRIEQGRFVTDESGTKWAEPIVAGVTKTRNWAEHIVEMRGAIDDIVAFVNSWDSASATNRIPAINWIPLRGRQPQADALEQIRQVIAWL